MLLPYVIVRASVVSNTLHAARDADCYLITILSYRICNDGHNVARHTGYFIVISHVMESVVTNAVQQETQTRSLPQWWVVVVVVGFFGGLCVCGCVWVWVGVGVFVCVCVCLFFACPMVCQSDQTIGFSPGDR